jgi:hypothetical protein
MSSSLGILVLEQIAVAVRVDSPITIALDSEIYPYRFLWNIGDIP